MYYYEIYVENNQGIYTYKSEEKYEIGQWCIVNFINKDKMGLIVAIVNENQIQFDISKVKKIKDAAPVLSIPSDIMQLIRWIKNYYISDYYSVIKAVYPGALKLNYSKKAIFQRVICHTFYFYHLFATCKSFANWHAFCAINYAFDSSI